MGTYFIYYRNDMCWEFGNSFFNYNVESMSIVMDDKTMREINLKRFKTPFLLSVSFWYPILLLNMFEL